MSRTCRCASARTCQTCQVARRDSSSRVRPGRLAAPTRSETPSRAVEPRRGCSAATPWLRQRPRRPEHLDRLGPPRRPLLGLRPRLVLGLPGLQVRLLRQRAPPRPASAAGRASRWNSLRQLAAAAPSMPARRCDHAAHSRASTPSISRTGRLPGVGAGPLGEPHAERRRPAALQRGVVGLRGGDDVLVQHPCRRSTATCPCGSAPCWRPRRGCAGRGRRRGSRGG